MHEKRQHPRAHVNLHVVCERKDGDSFTGVVRDVSLGGMFVETETIPPFGTNLSIRCQLPGMANESQLPAVVRWTKPDGFGVQFGLLGARETHAITGLLRG